MTPLIKFLRIVLLSFYWHLPFSSKGELSASWIITRELKQEKKRRKKKLPPPWHKQRRRREPVQHQLYRSTKAKDHRYSDQRKLRRMYTNL